ncbi:MAG: threonine--tRNA ligase [Candidatus Moraniibacteriota bacterium]|nr:MAG: threonine--tRNA ligase [Candidatus Moranbacteria bacterium]
MDAPLESIRHSLAHILASAVLHKDPRAKLGTGPATENGFFYDIEFSPGTTCSENDLSELEQVMRALLQKEIDFVRTEITPEDARKRFRNQPYKLELIQEITARKEPISIYTTGSFSDLCEGPHVSNTREIDPNAFKLVRLAGAYWKNDESKPQLTRITGVAFRTKAELEKYEWQREEAKKRDHRKLGAELGLFVFSDLVGPGLPLFTPKGTIIRDLLDNYVRELRAAKNYERVAIPHITKCDLYETSGHWSKFSEELFRVSTREKHEYALKPMNCPHHAQIFAASLKSYRDMPVRYAETTMVYRDEQSGELSGLSRVLAITQDDAHVFCRESQIETEVFSIWDIISEFYSTFGFDLSVRFSRHNPETFEKYLGTKEVWEKSENAIRKILDARHIPFLDGLGEAAMYGPKIDFIAKDSLGRTLQVATIQLDFNQPARFGLSCINERGEKEPIVMIHCAIMGSIERCMATLIEHYAGAFPLWLSPVQVTVLPVGEGEISYATSIAEALRHENFRVSIKTNESLGKRIRETKLEKVPYTIVVGKKEEAEKTLSVERRDEGKLPTLSLESFISRIRKERDERK